MKRILSVSTGLFLTMLAVVWAIPSKAKEPKHLVPADVSKVGDIPYPTSSLDAGVVTLTVELDNTGYLTGVYRRLAPVTS